MVQPSVDEYQVGWICALPSEYATAKAMLDEQYPMVPGQDRADTNSYTLGRIHEHNVVIACLPAGVDGTNAAAVVATNLCRTFRSVRFGLMVGIGGGIPNLSQGIDIRLGDVVVSQPSSSNGGVVQYDKKKSYDGGKFERKGQLNKPPLVLLTALSNLQAEHQIEESQVPIYLERMLMTRPKMRKLGYSFPAQEIDTLLCIHTDHTPQTSVLCKRCDDGMVKREPRESTDPVIHYGVIASGNQVVKSAAHRDQLRDDCDGAFCVEMEAAGLMDNFPCLVIRGICDYADSSKNDRWHNYAAATAAAFAKELLSYVSVGLTGREQPVQEILGFLTEAREHFRNQHEHIQQQQAHNQWQETHAQQQEIQKIPFIPQAMYGAQGEVHKACHPKTRVDLLYRVQQWAIEARSKPILWLNGQAGTGKSTISWTFAEWLANQNHVQQLDLGASFFFKRGDGDRGSAGRFFPTVIRQLVAKVPGLDVPVVKAIKSYPFIFDTALAEQFRRLVLHPLQDLDVSDTRQTTLIVVVDALDECENQTDMETILKLWSELSQLTTVRLRLFLASRPELTVRFQFQYMPTDIFQDIDLVSAVPESTIRDDIYMYLDDSLRAIGEKYNDRLQGTSIISPSWPNKDTVQRLVDLAVPLFIVAATICRFVGDPELNPEENLKEILSDRNIGGMSQMELTYLPVLSHLNRPEREHKHQEKLWHEFRMVVGSIIHLAEALSIRSLSSLLAVEYEIVSRRLAPLHSVLYIPADQYTPIRPLHLSFAEFLLSERAQKQPYGINSSKTHLELGSHCLRLLSEPGGLQEDICDLKLAGQSRHEVGSTVITGRISPVLQYACRYWVHHVKNSVRLLRDDDEVHLFLQQHFLHWLEALSLIGRISEVVGFLSTLRSCVLGDASNLLAFLEDARRFVLSHRYIIDLTPLQLYSSVIIFSPQNSLVRKTCGRIPRWIQQYPQVALGWGSELQKLEGHSQAVNVVAFSPNGSLLASGSDDSTIRVWDVQTGRQIQSFRETLQYASITAISFSLDGSLIASKASSRVIRIWEVQTGQARMQVEAGVQEHDSYLKNYDTTLFCFDGSLVASGLYETICIWDTRTGREVYRLERTFDWVGAMSFTSNGFLLASLSDDNLIKVYEVHNTSGSYSEMTQKWEVKMELDVQRFENEECATMSFSSDGSLLASRAYDQPIWVWDVQTGQQVQKLDENYAQICTISFSRDNSLLAVGFIDKTVRVYQIQTGQRVQTFEGHSYEVRTVSFSPNSSLLVSGSEDETVRVWGVQTVQEAQTEQGARTFEGHSEKVTRVCFSSDGSLFASGSSEGAIWVWEMQTGRVMQKLRNTLCAISILSFSLDGSLLAVSPYGDNVQVWEVQTGQQVQSLRNSQQPKILLFCPDNSLLTVGSWLGEICVWKMQTGRVVQRFQISGVIDVLSFSPDSFLLASASDRGVIEVWDMRNGRKVKAFQDVPTVRTMSFADSTTLITDRMWFDMVGGDSALVTTDEVQSIKEEVLTAFGDWIQYRGRNLLWLPRDYRGVSKSLHNYIVVGAESGRVSIFRFDLSKLEGR